MQTIAKNGFSIIPDLMWSSHIVCDTHHDERHRFEYVVLYDLDYEYLNKNKTQFLEQNWKQKQFETQTLSITKKIYNNWIDRTNIQLSIPNRTCIILLPDQIGHFLSTMANKLAEWSLVRGKKYFISKTKEEGEEKQ